MNSSANGTLLFSDWQEFGEVGQSLLSCQTCMQGAQGSDLVRLAHNRSAVTDTEISVLASNIVCMAIVQDTCTSTHVHMLVNRSAAFAMLTCQACRPHVQRSCVENCKILRVYGYVINSASADQHKICHMLIFEIRYLCEAVPNSATWILEHPHKCGMIHNGFTCFCKVMEL